MRFYINILATYYPDIDPGYDVYYRQILEQVELAEELGFHRQLEPGEHGTARIELRLDAPTHG